MKVPGGPVRPTQDMVREALFSMLAPRLGGARFLDLFAGSGAVGIEAWSRGAGEVWCVELDRRVQNVLRANVLELCGKENVRVVGADALRFLKKKLVDQPFDIIFSDPPYDREGRFGVLSRLLDAILEEGILAPRGVFVMEQEAREGLPSHEGWELRDERVYGNTQLRFFMRREMEGVAGTAEVVTS